MGLASMLRSAIRTRLSFYAQPPRSSAPRTILAPSPRRSSATASSSHSQQATGHETMSPRPGMCACNKAFPDTPYMQDTSHGVVPLSRLPVRTRESWHPTRSRDAYFVCYIHVPFLLGQEKEKCLDCPDLPFVMDRASWV